MSLLREFNRVEYYFCNNLYISQAQFALISHELLFALFDSMLRMKFEGGSFESTYRQLIKLM